LAGAARFSRQRIPGVIREIVCYNAPFHDGAPAGGPRVAASRPQALDEP
jgi:hypothetical protein